MRSEAPRSAVSPRGEILSTREMLNQRRLYWRIQHVFLFAWPTPSGQIKQLWFSPIWREVHRF